MKNNIIACFLITLTAWTNCGFIIGGVDGFINGSRATITIEYKSANRPHLTLVPLRRGAGLALMKDEGALVFLRLKYSEGRVITLNANDLAQKKAGLVSQSGMWWISDSGIRYVSVREANLMRKQLGFRF